MVPGVAGGLVAGGEDDEHVAPYEQEPYAPSPYAAYTLAGNNRAIEALSNSIFIDFFILLFRLKKSIYKL